MQMCHVSHIPARKYDWLICHAASCLSRIHTYVRYDFLDRQMSRVPRTYVRHDSPTHVDESCHSRIHIYVRHDSRRVSHVSWLITVWDMTHCYVCHDSYLCETWLRSHVTCVVIHCCVWHDSLLRVPWLIAACAMTHCYVCHDSLLHVPWLFFTHGGKSCLTHIHTYVKHDSPHVQMWIKSLHTYKCGGHDLFHIMCSTYGESCSHRYVWVWETWLISCHMEHDSLHIQISHVMSPIPIRDMTHHTCAHVISVTRIHTYVKHDSPHVQIRHVPHNHSRYDSSHMCTRYVCHTHTYLCETWLSTRSNTSCPP